jgi:hypothetical protein
LRYAYNPFRLEDVLVMSDRIVVMNYGLVDVRFIKLIPEDRVIQG